MAPDLALSAHLFAYEPLRFEHLKEAADAGFRKIELWAMTPNFDISDEARLKALDNWMTDLSLSTPSFHAPFYADLGEAREGRWLSLAAADSDAREAAIQKTIQALRAFRPLGARVAVIHPSAPGRAGDGDTYEALEASMTRLLPLAEETDAVIAVENIPSALGRAEPLAGFVERFDHPRLRICIDTGHALITEGENTRSGVERLAPFCAATHLHDNDGRKRRAPHPRRGRVRVGLILRCARCEWLPGNARARTQKKRGALRRDAGRRGARHAGAHLADQAESRMKANPTGQTRVHEHLKALARAHFGVGVTSLTPLAGDASTRDYVRLTHAGSAAPSSVGMILPEPFTKETLPFIDVQAHLGKSA